MEEPSEGGDAVKWIRNLAYLTLLGNLGVFAGCQSDGSRPRFGQGTINYQKARAADFDPYPLNDIGPAVVGGRPPGFFNPLPEPKRNELRANDPWQNYRR